MSILVKRALTVSGNEITDLLRALDVQGDGRTADSSFGIWEASTNLCTNGGFETNLTGWIAIGGAALLRSTGPGSFMFGSASMRVTCGALFDGASYALGTLAAATTYTGSCWIFSNTGGNIVLQVTNDVDQAPATAVTLAAGVWTRVTLTLTTNATVHTRRLFIYSNQAGAQTFFVDGVQLEQKVLATPYIHTDGGTAARAAARVQAPAALLDEAQGWVAARVRLGFSSADPNTHRIACWGDDPDRLIDLYFDGFLDKFVLWRANGFGTSQTVSVAAGAFAGGAVFTVVARWTATTLALSINGAPFSVVAAVNVPVLSAATFEIGTYLAGVGGWLDGDVLWLATGTGTLADADAALLAGWQDSPAPNQAPFVGLTGLWTCDDATYWAVGPGQVARDAVNCWVSWMAWNVGLLSFDLSLFSGADVFGVSPLDASFGGTYDDVSARLDRVTITRGRNDNLTTMLAGEASVDLRDPDGIFNPDNASGPLYGQLEDRLHPVKLVSTYGGIKYPRFYGWVDQFTWQPDGRRGITQLHCVDLFYWLGRATPVIAPTGPTTTGAAIGKILDAVGATDPAMRDLDAGDTILDFSANQPDVGGVPVPSTGTGSGLDLIAGLLEAERGSFFIAGTGKATYRSRLSRLTKTSSATITDHMNAMAPGVDFSRALTRVTVKRTQTGYSAVALADAASLSKIGYADVPEIDTPYLLADSEADALAAWVLSQVKTPRPPLYSFGLDNREDALLIQILARELVDRITVSATRGGTVGDYHIDNISETIDGKGGHSCAWLLSRVAPPGSPDFAFSPIVFGTYQFDVTVAAFVY